MATLEDPSLAFLARIESNGGLRTAIVPRGDGYVYSGLTGIMPAALAAGSIAFLMRSPANANRIAYIDRIRVQYTTIAAFTAPVTAGRRLQLFRGINSTGTSGGAAPANNSVAKKNPSTASNSIFDATQGGDVRIATTAGLTLTGGVWETEPLATMPLTHVGTAGANVEQIFEFSATVSAELVLTPNQYLTLRTPAAFDAGGTWQLAVKVDWREALAL